MRRWIVTALGQDRPGIVAGVTKVLYEAGCNLEDSAMSRLEGEFVIMLIFSSPHPLTHAWLQRAFQAVARRLDLTIHLKPLPQREAASPRQRGRTCVVSVYGADRPGIVFRMTQALAKVRANITDLKTHRSAGRVSRAHPSLYLVFLEVEVPAWVSLATVSRVLTQLARSLGVQVSVRKAGAELL